MWMTLGERRFAITLADNPAARAFAAQLPLTLDMSELNANEKHADLRAALPANASQPGTIRNGDLLLYGTNTLVVFYATFDSSYVPLRDATSPSRVSAAAVAFEPGARSAWHTHPLGQLLVVTAGTGRVQQWGGAVEEIRDDDVVWTPPGGGARRPERRLARAGVTDAQYASAPTRRSSGMSTDSAATASTPSPGPYADIAPALDQLTQQVLFGQVWERPGLSKRDRRLITVATLVAQYRTNELPYHLEFALQNGVTKDELTERVTHLAFYAGWPTANTAVGILRQAFAETAR
jgi:4-carboxymuconolactone decarboxylase